MIDTNMGEIRGKLTCFIMNDMNDIIIIMCLKYRHTSLPSGVQLQVLAFLSVWCKGSGYVLPAVEVCLLPSSFSLPVSVSLAVLPIVAPLLSDSSGGKSGGVMSLYLLCEG